MSTLYFSLPDYTVTHIADYFRNVKFFRISSGVKVHRI